jgi:putative DNA primase/helicase
MLNAALEYAARGWQVFPLRPRAKEPATWNGFYSGTSNPATIRRWFGRGYPYNLAVRTGVASGVLVFDCDTKKGAISRHRLEHEHGPLPRTLMSQTARGPHLWFAIDVPVPSSIERVAAKIDIRADSGYAVAPPSVHPSGVVYRWLNDLPLAPAPTWLIRLAQKPVIVPAPPPAPPPTITIITGSSAAYGLAALGEEIAILATTSSGYRNKTLNLTSFRLHQLVAGGELNESTVKQHLIAACKTNQLIQDSGLRAVEATIASGARAGLRFPRNRWGRR